MPPNSRVTSPSHHDDIGPQVLLEVGRLAGRVEQFLAHQTRHEDRLKEHDDRISVLENHHQARKGWVAGASAVAAAVGALISWVITNIGSLVR